MAFKLRSGNTPLYKGLGGAISRIGDRIRSGVSKFQQKRLSDPNREGVFSAENVSKRMRRRANRRADRLANPDTRGVHSTLGGVSTQPTSQQHLQSLAEQANPTGGSGSALTEAQRNEAMRQMESEIRMQNLKTGGFPKKNKRY